MCNRVETFVDYVKMYYWYFSLRHDWYNIDVIEIWKAPSVNMTYVQHIYNNKIDIEWHYRSDKSRANWWSFLISYFLLEKKLSRPR